MLLHKQGRKVIYKSIICGSRTRRLAIPRAQAPKTRQPGRRPAPGAWRVAIITFHNETKNKRRRRREKRFFFFPVVVFGRGYRVGGTARVPCVAAVVSTPSYARAPPASLVNGTRVTSVYYARYTYDTHCRIHLYIFFLSRRVRSCSYLYYYYYYCIFAPSKMAVCSPLAVQQPRPRNAASVSRDR